MDTETIETMTVTLLKEKSSYEGKNAQKRSNARGRSLVKV